MNRRAFAAAGILAAACFAAVPAAHAAETVRIAFHVDENDPGVMNLALNNAANVMKHYADKGVETQIEIVTYGPGLTMLLDGRSPVAQRVAAMSLEHPNMQFSACANTMAAMAKKTGSEPKLLSEAVVVPSGVVRLVELQGEGYAYVKP